VSDDLRFAPRALGRRPGASFAAGATLALAIGASVARTELQRRRASASTRSSV